VSGEVFVIVYIPNDDRESIGTGNGWMTVVSHNDGQVVLLSLFTIESFRARHNASAIAVLATT